MFKGKPDGLLPTEISIMKYYRDDNFISVWIGAGIKGWFYVYGTSIRRYKEMDGNEEDNFNEAYEEVRTKFGEINEVQTIENDKSEVARNVMEGSRIIFVKGDKLGSRNSDRYKLLPYEVQKEELYLDERKLVVIISAGEIGWYIKYGISDSIVKLNNASTEDNFKEAYDEATKKYGELKAMLPYNMTTQK